MSDSGAYISAATDLAAMDRESEGQVYNLPPEEPTLPPGEWIKKNLFSSVGSGFLTVIFTIILLLTARGILGFIFSPERQWDATATNMQLLLVGAYSKEQFIRIWVSFGFIITLGGLSAAAWQAGGRVYVAKLSRNGMALGAAVAGIGILAPFSGGARVSYLLVGAAIFVAGLAVLRYAPEHSHVSLLGVAITLAALAVGSLWVVPYGHHAFENGEVITESGTVQASTQGPWTVMVLIAIASYWIGKAIVPRVNGNALRGLLVGLWFSAPLIVVFFILRDPDFDYGHIASTEIPIYLGYAIAGGLLLYALANPRIGELGRIVAAVVLIAAAGSFLFSMLMVVRILALLLALFALAAPTFSGDRAARIRYSVVWAVFSGLVLWLVTAINSPSTVESTSAFLLSGLGLTLVVSIYTMILSFPLGVLLALARTSKMPLFRIMSTVYIEFVRGIPLITILIFFSVLVPLFLPENMELTEIASVTIGFVLFSAAYLAENVRGGLQSVRRGQYEAAEALGMTTAQKTVFIILPQALRVSIPPLVGQTIATYKETSLLAIIGLFDLLYVGRTLIAAQTDFLGSAREQFLFISVLYWAGAYALSRASLNLERKLGVGER